MVQILPKDAAEERLRWIKPYLEGKRSLKEISEVSPFVTICTHAFGAFIYQFPEFLPKIKKWAGLSNQWLCRASAVVLIYSLRKGKYLNEAFSMAKTLMKDNEDLVQKGYGWMLKEASNLYPKEVFNFVVKNKKIMPWTALRYAIEKLPGNMKK